jgi:hypothetical protein
MQKLLLVSTIVLLFASVKANTNVHEDIADTVIVNGIEGIYKKGDPIAFTITNASPDTLWVGPFHMFSFVDEENDWFITVHDLLNKDCAAKLGQTVIMLPPNERLDIDWRPKRCSKSCFNYRKIIGKFEIRIRWYKSSTEAQRHYIKTRRFEIVG